MINEQELPDSIIERIKMKEGILIAKATATQLPMTSLTS